MDTFKITKDIELDIMEVKELIDNMRELDYRIEEVKLPNGYKSGCKYCNKYYKSKNEYHNISYKHEKNKFNYYLKKIKKIVNEWEPLYKKPDSFLLQSLTKEKYISKKIMDMKRDLEINELLNKLKKSKCPFIDTLIFIKLHEMEHDTDVMGYLHNIIYFSYYKNREYIKKKIKKLRD